MKYDLTTTEGRKNATNDLIPFLFGLGVGMVAVKLPEILSQKDTENNQKRLTENLIRLGKESNVDNLEIEVDKTTGLDFNATIEGVPVKAIAGTNGKTVIKAKYK